LQSLVAFRSACLAPTAGGESLPLIERIQSAPPYAGSPGGHRGRGRWGPRLGAVLLGVVLAPILLEVALRAAALFVSESRAAEEGDCLLLCQGDSNVFGLYVPAECSFPGQLEALLRERAPDPPPQKPLVVNRGVPGKASWIVRDEIEADLERYHPRAVAVLVGMNSRWSLPPGRDAWPWLGKLRVVRCWRLFWNRFREPAPPAADDPMAEREARAEELADIPPEANVAFLDVAKQRVSVADRTGVVRPFVLDFGQPGTQDVQTWIREDLLDTVAKIRAFGSRPFLVLYPLDETPFREINKAIEDAARECGAPLVDCRAEFLDALDAVGRDALLFRDEHLTQAGYAILSREMFRNLVAEGLVAGGEGPALAEAASAGLVSAPKLEVTLASSGGEIDRIEVSYAPGFAAQVLLSRGAGEARVAFGKLQGKRPLSLAGPERGLALGLRDDVLLRQCLARQAELRVFLPSTGRGRVSLGPLLAGAPPSSADDRDRWKGIVLILDPRGGCIAQSEIFDLVAAH
jgi:lysophospholipase L1-like esterase